MRLCPSCSTKLKIIQAKGRYLNVLVTPYGLGILLWPSSKELLGPGKAVAVVGLGLRIIPLGQWLDSHPCLYCGPQDSEGTNRQTSPSTLFSTVDTDEIPAKRPRLDCFIHQVKNSLYNAASLFGFPFQLTTKPMVTSACNGTRNVAPSGEVFSNSSSCELTGSGSWNNMLKLGNKSPNGISDYPKIRVTVTRDQPRRVLPSFGFTLNSEGYNRRPGGRRHSKGNPESSFMWKPQEQAVTEMISEESGKGLRRPHCTVEEGVQKEEREKYRRLLERLKESGHGNSVCPVTSGYHSSQRSQMDTLKTKGWGEEQNHGVKTTQFVPKQYRLVETRGPLCSLRSEKRCSKGKISDTEKMIGIRFENESRKGYQLEPDLSEEVSARLRLGSGSNGLLRRKVSIETKEKNCSGKERDRRTDDLLELTEDMEKEISNALGHGPQDEILSCAFKLRITRGDIQTLKNYHWLNDEVINFYMNLLVERNRKQGYPALHVFSTFFYPKLKSGGYQAVKRWTKGVNLFEQEIILVPIHRKVHWSLVVIDLRKKCLKYLDSMGQKGHRICEILLQYLQDESKTKRNTDLNLLEWTHYSMKPHEIPQQLNGSDCGMFTCKYADYISRDKPITFTQHQMPLFRKKMVWEILHQQLL
ncbi:PREDICTED: sentrin-specific protease 2 isoform X2 [Mandrillus leucophaeus]|uniref:sentrin-specific protease 2 isoform X2 n=1 Tax=Mandrillus leucophaeus TaxID=9568 RepID=UPI0005F37489|nr:PREDICTED: sentrin-specific protease 2 isoform X2 [Mandrillus leucophaeus]